VTVATLTADEGAELIAQLRAGKQSLQVTSSPTTDYVYDVAHHMHGIAEDLTYQPRQSDLARVDVSFRNNQPGIGMEMRTDVWKGISAANALRTPVQGERTDWVSADKDWSELASIGTELLITNDWSKHYEAGTTSRLEYFGPIQRPRMSTYNRAVRYGDFFDVLVPTWTDSQAGHIGTTPTNGDVRSTMKLYQGDTLVASNPWYRLRVPTLAPERLPYRLVSENSRGKWKNDYSTTTRTEWGFTSGRPADGELELPPLVQLDYTVEGIDASGKAKRHADLVVTPAHLQGGPSSDTIQKVSLDVSYDDGVTWHQAALSHTDQGWSTRLNAPAGAQFVTLRASASDTQGNSVVQDITRAFGLK
jgi:hypothetical protein